MLKKFSLKKIYFLKCKIIEERNIQIFKKMCIFKKFLRYHFCTIVLVSYMDSALNMDTTSVVKCNKFYRHMALHVCEEKQLKR